MKSTNHHKCPEHDLRTMLLCHLENVHDSQLSSTTYQDLSAPENWRCEGALSSIGVNNTEIRRWSHCNKKRTCSTQFYDHSRPAMHILQDLCCHLHPSHNHNLWLTTVNFPHRLPEKRQSFNPRLFSAPHHNFFLENLWKSYKKSTWIQTRKLQF